MGSIGRQIAVAKSDADVERCSPVMRELRPHLSDAAFLQQVKRQMARGYLLAFLEVKGEVMAVAGYRISECLSWGKFLYVDDLVTRETDRSKGYGATLFDWLVGQAVKEGCAQFH